MRGCISRLAGSIGLRASRSIGASGGHLGVHWRCRGIKGYVDIRGVGVSGVHLGLAGSVDLMGQQGYSGLVGV